MRKTYAAPLAFVVLMMIPKLSRAADPTTVDCLGASEDAVKMRASHRLRDMRQQLLVCAASTCPTDIRTECARRVTEVNAAIPTVVFEVRDPDGVELTAVHVEMDGKPLLDRLEGIAVSLDPGEHAFVFTAGSLPPVEKKFVLHEGEKDRHERVLLTARAVAPPAPPPVPVAAPLPSPPPPSPLPPPPSAPAAEPGHESTSGRSIAPWIAGGVGVAGVVVGSVFGVRASSSWKDAQSACASATSCAQHDAAVSDRSRAVTSGTVSTIAFATGAVGIAAGAILWLTKPKSDHAVALAPSVAPGTAGLSLRGNF